MCAHCFRRLIVITDSPSTSTEDPVAMASTLKTGTFPVQIYTIGVGTAVDSPLLSQIASAATGDYVKTVLDWNFLNGLVTSLVDHMCDMSVNV